MANDAAHDPQVPVQLHLPPACLRDIEADGALRDAVRAAITDACDHILADLGIPGHTEAGFRALDRFRRAYPLRLDVHDRQLRCSVELLARVHSDVQGRPLHTGDPPHLLEAWLRAADGEQSRAFLAENHQNVIDFLHLTCAALIKQQPSVLLADTQVASLLHALPELQRQPPVTWLLPILRQVLDRRISLADRRTVAHVLDRSSAGERAPADVAEQLIAALRPDTVEIRMPGAYLRALTLADAATEHDSFPLLRDGLFYELGLTFPDFRFVPTDDLKPGTFAFKINHLTTLPYVGLQADQVAVNAYPEALQKIGVAAQPAVNPANWGSASLIEAADVEVIRENGYWIWEPMAYIALALSEALRTYGAALIDTQVVQSQLSALTQIHPALTRAIQEKFTVAQLAQVERELVSDGLSVRNLRAILERLLDYDVIVVDPRARLILDDRIAFLAPPDDATLTAPVHLARFVRIGMKRAIGHDAIKSQPSTSLATYLLDKDAEALCYAALADGTLHAEAFRRRVLDALEKAFSPEPLPATPPSLLVGQMLRAPLRAITATDFPRLRIWAFEELPANIALLPVATITL